MKTLNILTAILIFCSASEARRVRGETEFVIIPFYGNAIVIDSRVTDVPIERVEQCIRGNRFKLQGEYWIFYNDELKVKVRITDMDANGRRTRYWRGDVVSVEWR